MTTRKLYGEVLNAHISQLNNDWAVYAFSPKYKKVVNTHVFPDRKEAIKTMKEINK